MVYFKLSQITHKTSQKNLVSATKYVFKLLLVYFPRDFLEQIHFLTYFPFKLFLEIGNKT